MPVEGIDVWRVLKGAGVKYVNFVIVDIFGRPRVDVMSIDAAKDAFVDGIPYDGSSIPALHHCKQKRFSGRGRSFFGVCGDLERRKDSLCLH